VFQVRRHLGGGGPTSLSIISGTLTGFRNSTWSLVNVPRITTGSQPGHPRVHNPAF
jgi:hypothetical protein